MTSHNEKSQKAKTRKQKKETIIMKTKLTKTIMSSLTFACALVCLVAAMALGTSATARPAPTARGLQRGHAKGLVYVDLRRVHRLRWEPGTESRYARPPVQRRWYDVSITFGTVNIGGTTIIDATGGVGTYTVAADCTGTLSITNGPSFNMYVGPGAKQLWITQIAGAGAHGIRCRNGDTAAVVKAPTTSSV